MPTPPFNGKKQHKRAAAPAAGMTYRIGGTHDFAAGAENWIVDFTGCSEDDWLVARTINNGPTPALGLGPSGVTNIPTISTMDADGAFYNGLYAIQITAAMISHGRMYVDAAATLHFSVRWDIWTIAGATAITKVGSLVLSGGPDATLTFPSFTPSGSSKGAGVSIIDRGSSGPAITPVTGWSMRANPSAADSFTFYTADRATGAGASTAWGNFDTADLQAGYLWEAT